MLAVSGNLENGKIGKSREESACRREMLNKNTVYLHHRSGELPRELLKPVIILHLDSFLSA